MGLDPLTGTPLQFFVSYLRPCDSVFGKRYFSKPMGQLWEAEQQFLISFSRPSRQETEDAAAVTRTQSKAASRQAHGHMSMSQGKFVTTTHKYLCLDPLFDPLDQTCSYTTKGNT